MFAFCCSFFSLTIECGSGASSCNNEGYELTACTATFRPVQPAAGNDQE